ncbi:MAG: hypothetical protein JXA57_12190 [Armatimonadetes bacterium]|nr:hypothetical protein [Armatimonadota bacterium]
MAIDTSRPIEAMIVVADIREGRCVISYFAIPKAFSNGEIARIQDLAIRSWSLSAPDVEVMLFGDDFGVEDHASAVGARYMGAVAKTQFGTPLVSEAFKIAQERATHDVICYANCDIVLTTRLPTAVGRIPFRRYLACGRRTEIAHLDLEISDGADWERSLERQALLAGKKGELCALDYFVFTRDALEALPSFAVGRAGWDNWLIFSARRRRVPVIDMSEVVLAIHQRHDYSHVPLARQPNNFLGPESDSNLRHVGKARGFSLEDAGYCLTNQGAPPYLLRHPGSAIHKLCMASLLHHWMKPISIPLRTVQEFKSSHRGSRPRRRL